MSKCSARLSGGESDGLRELLEETDPGSLCLRSGQSSGKDTP